MKILEQRHEIWGTCPTSLEDSINWIERAGRMCYRSEDKIIEGSGKVFVDKIIEHGHTAVIEQSNFVVQTEHQPKHVLELYKYQRAAWYSPFIYMTVYKGEVYAAGNYRAWMELLELDTIDELFEYFNKPDNQFSQVTDLAGIPELLKAVTISFLINRATSHELVRHRPASYCQECISGDTKVTSDYTIKQLFDRSKTRYGRTHNKTIDLKSVDEFGNIVKNKIIEVFHKGKGTVYEVTTKLGYKIQTTLNHEFMVEDNKFTLLRDLRVKDKIVVNGRPLLRTELSRSDMTRLYVEEDFTVQQIADHIAKGPVRYNGGLFNRVIRELREYKIYDPTKNPEKYNKNHKSTSWKGNGQHFLNDDNEPWNKGLSEYDHPSIKKQANTLREYHHANGYGEKNSNYSGGSSGHVKAQELKSEIVECELCKSSKRLEVHHKDRIKENNIESNLIKVCCKCHNKLHHGWQVGTITHLDEIESIEKIGETDLYDLEMQAPHHNYVANGFVVHNSQRYCSYRDELEVILPPHYQKLETDSEELNYNCWKDGVEAVENIYKFLINKDNPSKERAEQARSILPNCTATRITVTAVIPEWRWIFYLRTSKAADPSMRQIMLKVQENFQHHRAEGIF